MHHKKTFGTVGIACDSNARRGNTVDCVTMRYSTEHFGSVQYTKHLSKAVAAAEATLALLVALCIIVPLSIIVALGIHYTAWQHHAVGSGDRLC